jgi:hypothetical protein
VLIQAYIDESIGKNRTFALGCAIAKDSTWARINHDWKRCLQRKNSQLTRQSRPRFSRYHATYCESRLGEFEGWDVPEKNAFVAELISIVNRHHVHIVGFTLYLEDLAEFYPQFEKEIEKAAYGALATLLFPEIVEQASQISRQPAIKLVYEHGDVTQNMQYAYDSMKLNKPFAELFVSVEKDNWKAIPLQIADLIAFETMKDRDNQKGAVIRDRRRSLDAILGGKLTGAKGFHFGRDGLQRLVSERKVLKV